MWAKKMYEMHFLMVFIDLGIVKLPVFLAQKNVELLQTYKLTSLVKNYKM